MINRFEIKQINGEERLFLYFDFNFEFGSVDKTFKKTIQEEIKEFMKKNNIHFHGKIISLVVGGILIGNLILTPGVKSINKEDLNVNPQIIEVDKLLKVPEVMYNKTEEMEKENEDLTQKIAKEEIINNNIIEKNTNNSDFVASSKKNSFDEIIESNVNQNTSINTNLDIVESSKEEAVILDEEKKIDQNYITIKRSNGQVLTLELEEYLVGVVGAEMPALFHIEALKAQSIVARTYTLKAIKDGKILTDTESTQSYKSESELKNLWGESFNVYYSKIKDAVNATKGMYLSYNGAYIEAVYHSTSNGKTETSSNVWKNFFPYLVSVESKYDSLNPSFSYEIILSYSEISNRLGIDVNQDTTFTILEMTEGNRVSKILVNDILYKGVDFRIKLQLRSADFDIEKQDTGVKFTTRGYGHGVGMSQYGANGMAKNGSDYSSILKHYYQGVTISHL